MALVIFREIATSDFTCEQLAHVAGHRLAARRAVLRSLAYACSIMTIEPQPKGMPLPTVRGVTTKASLQKSARIAGR